MLKIVVYVPKDSTETVKDAMFKAGAGKLGHYDQCSWQVLGQGQFRALEGANPHIGAQGVVERVEEFRIEMVCEDLKCQMAIEALKKVHPYETPAYEVIRILDF